MPIHFVPSHPGSRRAAFSCRLLFALALLGSGGLTTVRGQSALDGFDPNANGFVVAVVTQPDGKILIGGDFTTLAPNAGATVTRNHIARLNPDGTLDPTFAPNADARVDAIALQPDGKILVGGQFTSIGGQPRNHVARLDPATGAADSFDPNIDAPVHAFALQADRKVLVGGFFSNVGGQARKGLARLDPATGQADSFKANLSDVGGLFVIAVQTDGKILVAGSFLNIGGQTRRHIARLDPATGQPDSFNPSPNSSITAMLVQTDGKILVGGHFFGTNSIGGQSRTRMARLDPATGLADSLDPHTNDAVLSIAVQADGRILIGGSFTTVGGQSRNRLARLDATTGAPDSYDPNTNGTVVAIALQADGKLLAGGLFNGATGLGAQVRNYIARLETDGRLDQTLDLSTVGDWLAAIAVQPDGKILIGGSFTSVLGVPRNNIARLNSDGTLDTAFDPTANHWVLSITVQRDGNILAGGRFTNIGGQTRNSIARLHPTTGTAEAFDPNANAPVYAIAIQADGQILVGGLFAGIGGQTRNCMARLDPTTGLADSFNPNANYVVYTIAVQADGKILAGGFFNGANSIGGQSRNFIARLDPTTGLADAFDPNANGPVYSIAVQPDGKILACGAFAPFLGTSIGGQPRNHIARLDPATGLADSFDPDADADVYGIAVQADGKILASGAFTSIGGQPRNRIARLNATTGSADSFDPNANNYVTPMAVQADGKIIVGGYFTTIGGHARSLCARLTNDTAALQDLSVTQSAITWTRGGSSPQLARSSFEYSNDNVTYTPLGSGTPTSTNWTLADLNFPIGQIFYVRARGFYRGGLYSSESLTESVRKAFVGPLQLTAAVSHKTHGSAGDFDLPLPLVGDPGVECRSSDGNHTLVFTFSNNVVSGGASVTSRTGSVSGSPTLAGKKMTVSLSRIADVQKITVTLSSVTDEFGQVLPNTAVSVNMLVGDTTANKTVNASDIAQTKSQSGVQVGPGTFRNDTTVSGAINGSDIGQVKSNSGHAVP